MKFVRIAVSLLAAPLGPAVVYAIIVYFNSGPGPIVSRSDAFHASILFGAIAYAVALADTVILGIPAFLLGLYLKAIRWWTTLLAAYLVGAIPYGIGTWTPDRSMESLSSYLYGIIAFGLFGLSGGLVFWLLWRYWILRVASTSTDILQGFAGKD